MDNICNMQCPPFWGEVAYCCKWCNPARASHVADENRHLWTEDKGFWNPTGCLLKREDMPQECREYDCHEDRFIVWKCSVMRMRWEDGKWIATRSREDEGWVNEKQPELFIDKIRKLADVE
ncbi:hypothetical protein LCGC14_1625460 [marine sediment metagenome]|uniref:Uncharacterized protein n=1 Tax=marine sediment metagenome TaxID=412755 RepID=A0A0F9IR64_9ZZZZ